MIEKDTVAQWEAAMQKAQNNAVTPMQAAVKTDVRTVIDLTAFVKRVAASEMPKFPYHSTDALSLATLIWEARALIEK